MKWIWFPLFLIFAMVEYIYYTPICGSVFVTGTMWFMWLMMAVVSSKVYIEKALNGNN